MDFQLTYIDLLIIAVLVVSGFFGAWRGLVKEMLAIAGWAAASFALLYGFNSLQPVTRDFIRNTAIADFITGTLLFAGTLVIVSVVTHFLSKWVRGSAFGGADRSLGFIFGIIRGGLIVIMIFFLYQAAEPDSADYPPSLKTAKSLPYLQQGAEVLTRFVQNQRPQDLGDDNDPSISKEDAKHREKEYKDIEKNGLVPPAP